MFRLVFGALIVVCLNTPARAGRVFVVSKAKQALEVYDSDNGKLEFSINGTGGPHTVILSADGQYVPRRHGGTKNTITVSTSEKARAHAEPGPQHPAARLVLNHDG
jgi:hypothetical protein